MKISQLIAVMCLLAVSDHNHAQATEKEIGLEEITVTAQRRAESLQEADAQAMLESEGLAFVPPTPGRPGWTTKLKERGQS